MANIKKLKQHRPKVWLTADSMVGRKLKEVDPAYSDKHVQDRNKLVKKFKEQ
jgi:hypothetical protein